MSKAHTCGSPLALLLDNFPDRRPSSISVADFPAARMLDREQTLAEMQQDGRPDAKYRTILRHARVIERFAGDRSQFFSDVTNDNPGGAYEWIWTTPDGRVVTLMCLKQFGPHGGENSVDQNDIHALVGALEADGATLKAINESIHQANNQGGIHGIVYLHRCRHVPWTARDNFRFDMIRLILGNEKSQNHVKICCYPNGDVHPGGQNSCEDRQTVLENWSRIVAGHDTTSFDNQRSDPKELVRGMVDHGGPIILSLATEMAKTQKLQKTQPGKRLVEEFETRIRDIDEQIKEAVPEDVGQLKEWRQRLKEARDRFQGSRFGLFRT
ncbi:hypothetical protein B0T14DRAFT_530816, partial [Immersiella caudata]